MSWVRGYMREQEEEGEEGAGGVTVESKLLLQ
jgi:hypothetical protein